MAYKCPTSEATTATVDDRVNRQTLAEIERGIDPITVECHSDRCRDGKRQGLCRLNVGNTTFSVLPGEDRTCPKCKSNAHIYVIGTYRVVDVEDGLDATEYGDEAWDAKPPKRKRKGKRRDRKNARDESGVRKGFDADAMRARICRNNGWDWGLCVAIFNVKGGDEVLTRPYFDYLRASEYYE